MLALRPKVVGKWVANRLVLDRKILANLKQWRGSSGHGSFNGSIIESLNESESPNLSREFRAGELGGAVEDG